MQNGGAASECQGQMGFALGLSARDGSRRLIAYDRRFFLGICRYRGRFRQSASNGSSRRRRRRRLLTRRLGERACKIARVEGFKGQVRPLYDRQAIGL